MLKKIKLYGDLKKITGHAVLEAHIRSTGEAIRFLLMNWPELETYMNSQYYQVLADDEEILESEINYPFANEIKIVPMISGAGGGARRFILGAALIGIGIASGGTGLALNNTQGFGFFGKGIAASLGNVGLGLTLIGVTDLLFPMPKPSSFENDEDPRISFDFSGTPNTSRAGTTHAICYGEIFTGSTVISMNLTTDQVTA
mgnify:FL=1